MIPFIENAGKCNLIYRAEEQISGCLKSQAGKELRDYKGA